MKIKFESIFDEVHSTHSEIQGKVFDLVGICNGRVLAKDEQGNMHSLPSHLVKTVEE